MGGIPDLTHFKPLNLIIACATPLLSCRSSLVLMFPSRTWEPVRDLITHSNKGAQEASELIMFCLTHLLLGQNTFTYSLREERYIVPRSL